MSLKIFEIVNITLSFPYTIHQLNIDPDLYYLLPQKQDIRKMKISAVLCFLVVLASSQSANAKDPIEIGIEIDSADSLRQHLEVCYETFCLICFFSTSLI